jgi:hypothetical protein
MATGSKSKKIRPGKITKKPTIWDGDRYFDATFTANEFEALRRKLMDVCGYDNYISFEYDIFRPAEEAVWPVFKAQGLDYERDNSKLCDYALIYICKQLGVEYRSFAANAPKLPIDGFIERAKRLFPEFRHPRNAIELKIQEHKLHGAWVDWQDEECRRTGCTCESHWLCSDRFVDCDYAAILRQIAEYNQDRPKFAPPKLVYSRA